MNELALFAGAGGGILGGKLLGWRTVCAVELNAYCSERLMQRQNEEHLSPFPIWDDVCSFDGFAWRGVIDVVSGGFPCTDISTAGLGAGINGEESGLWREMARIVGEVRPRFVLVENSPALTFRGGTKVVGDLASMGYGVRWGVMGAADAIWLSGDPCIDHKRDRIWLLAFTDAPGFGRREAGSRELASSAYSNANSKSERWREAGAVRHSQSSQRSTCCHQASSDTEKLGLQSWTLRVGTEEVFPNAHFGNQEACNPNGFGCRQVEQDDHSGEDRERSASEASQSVAGWWSAEPDVDRVVHGLAHRVDRLRAIGNGQVPAVVKLAWETLTGGK